MYKVVELSSSSTNKLFLSKLDEYINSFHNSQALPLKDVCSGGDTLEIMWCHQNLFGELIAMKNSVNLSCPCWWKNRKVSEGAVNETQCVLHPHSLERRFNQAT